MANLTLRSTTSATDPGSTTAKGSALSHTEIDSNFILLNNELANVSLGVLPANSVSPTELQDSGDFTVNTITTTGNVIVGDSVKPSTGNLEFNSDYIQISSADGTNKFKIRTDTAPGADQILKYNSTTGFVQWANDAAQSGSAQSQSGANFVLSSASNLDLNNNKIINAAAGSTLGITLENDTIKVGETTAEITTTPATDLVISTSGNDTDIILKTKDSSGTLNQAAHFNTLTAKINSTDGDLSTEASVHEPVMDIPKGIRIGTTAAGLSSTGALTANNNAGDWATTGITITNGDRNQWPTLDLISYGGANPLKNSDFDHDGDGTPDDGTTVFGGIFNTFPNAGMTMKAAGGTESSPSALASGKRLGVLGFMGHDGDGFGGTGAIASASLSCESAETFSNSNARGVKLIFDVLPTGGSASDGNASSDRRHQLTMTGSTVQIGNENHDAKYVTMDSSNGVLDFTDTAIKLGEVGSAPSTATDHGFVYAKDDSGTAEVYVKDGAGNETKISPHNQSGEWEYFSRNTATGKVVRVNMEALIREVENLSGKTFIENE